MAGRMVGVRVVIRRYVSDEPQPGIVACEFSDAQGRSHHFVEKTAVVSAEYLGADTGYPRPRVIACAVVSRGRGGGGEVVTVDTERPWGVASAEGVTRFEVAADSLVEWEYGDGVERPWSGAEPGAAANTGGGAGS